MIGLPTETDDDIKGIASLAQRAYDRAKAAVPPEQRGNVRVGVSCALFVPKAQTPFQWDGQIPREEALRRVGLLRRSVKYKAVDVHWHDPETSFIEAVMSRAGREAADWVEAAWRRGARFDAWSELFREEAWRDAAQEVGIDVAALAETSFDPSRVMPWAHVSTGVSTRSWRWSAAAPPKAPSRPTAPSGTAPAAAPARHSMPKTSSWRCAMADPRLFRLRVTFCKQGRLALLSHLEVARALERAVRRAGLPYAVSQGFSPHMRIAFGAALPVGVGGTRECFDLLLERYVSPERALEALQAASAPDLMAKSCAYLEPTAPAASVAFPVSTYRALLSCSPLELPVPRSLEVVRKKKRKTLVVDDFLVGEMELAGAVVTFTLEAKPTGSLRPDVLLSACMDAYNEDPHARDAEGFSLVAQATPSVMEAAPCEECERLSVVSVTRIDQKAADGRTRA